MPSDAPTRGAPVRTVTTTPHGRLILTVLRGLAEFERELIRARTSDGRPGSKARGVKVGRRPKLTIQQKRARPSLASPPVSVSGTLPVRTTLATHWRFDRRC